MSHALRLVLCFSVSLLLALLLALPGFAATDFSSLEKAVQEDLAATGTPGAAVIVVSGDRVVFAKGFGTSNVEIGETGAPVTLDTLFQVGSVTKLLTATAVVAYAQEGKLRLDAPLGTYVKGLAPRVAEVTVGQLLSQTSGMRDEPAEYGPHDESALLAAARAWKDSDRPLPPGAAFSYSNPGLALAGLAFQEASGKPFADLMAERLFTPLGMSHSTFRPTEAMTRPLSMGHSAEGEGKPTVVRPMADDARFWPAGSTLYTSANDLARFVRAFLNGGRLDGKPVISPAVLSQVAKPHADIPALFEDGHYGYGLMLFREKGLRVAEHAGTMTGFSGLIRMVPEHHFGLIVLANRSGVRLRKTTDEAMRLLLPVKTDNPAAERPALPVPAEERARLTGFYSARWPMEVFEKEGKLFLRRFDQELEMTKVGDRRFVARPSGNGNPQELVFGPDGPDGHPLYLHMALWAFARAAG